MRIGNFGISEGNVTPRGNITNGIGTDTIPQPNVTDTTPPDIPQINNTQSDGSGGGANETIIPGPPPECPEGEKLAPDGLAGEPIVAEEPITAEETTPTECDEGEELIDGQCQATPTEEEDEPDEEEDTGGDGDGGDGDGGDEGAESAYG